MRIEITVKRFNVLTSDSDTLVPSLGKFADAFVKKLFWCLRQPLIHHCRRFIQVGEMLSSKRFGRNAFHPANSVFLSPI